MANELVGAVCPGLYLCIWFFTSELKSFYQVYIRKKKRKKKKKKNKVLQNKLVEIYKSP